MWKRKYHSRSWPSPYFTSHDRKKTKIHHLVYISSPDDTVTFSFSFPVCKCTYYDRLWEHILSHQMVTEEVLLTEPTTFWQASFHISTLEPLILTLCHSKIMSSFHISTLRWRVKVRWTWNYWALFW